MSQLLWALFGQVVDWRLRPKLELLLTALETPKIANLTVTVILLGPEAAKLSWITAVHGIPALVAVNVDLLVDITLANRALESERCHSCLLIRVHFWRWATGPPARYRL